MPCSHSYFEIDGCCCCAKCGHQERGPEGLAPRRKSRSKRMAGEISRMLAIALPVYLLLGGGIYDVEPFAYEAYFAFSDAGYQAYYAITGAEPVQRASGGAISLADIKESRPISGMVSQALEPISPALVAARDATSAAASYVRGEYAHSVPLDYSAGSHNFKYVIGELGGLSLSEARAAAYMAERAWEESGSGVSFERLELLGDQTPAGAEAAFVIDYVRRNTAKVSDLGDHAGYFSCSMAGSEPHNRYVETCRIFAYVEDMACNGKWMKVSTRSLGGTIEHEIGHFLLTPKMSHHPSKDHLMYGDVDYTEYPFDPRGLVMPSDIAQYLEYEELEMVQAESDRLGPVIYGLEAEYEARAEEYDAYTSRIMYEAGDGYERADSLYEASERARIELNSAIYERNGLIDVLNEAYGC